MRGWPASDREGGGGGAAYAVRYSRGRRRPLELSGVAGSGRGEGGEGRRSGEVERAGGEWSNGGRESTPALMSDEML